MAVGQAFAANTTIFLMGMATFAFTIFRVPFHMMKLSMRMAVNVRYRMLMIVFLLMLMLVLMVMMMFVAVFVIVLMAVFVIVFMVVLMVAGTRITMRMRRHVSFPMCMIMWHFLRHSFAESYFLLHPYFFIFHMNRLKV